MEEYLLINYHLDLLEGQERDAVESWLAKSKANQSVYAQCIQIWEHAKASGNLQDLDVDGDLARVHAQIGNPPPLSNRKWTHPWIWRVAALLVLGIGLMWAYAEFVPSDAEAALLTFTTEAERSAPFQLADGSQVILNTHSKLTYPADFSDGNRAVSLSGGAWFKVKSDPDHPFSITHGASKTEVLGTEFDVDAYPGANQVTVAVKEGKVRLSALEHPESAVLLAKGQVGSFDSGKTTVLDSSSQNLNLDAWRTRSIAFENASLKKVIRVLERHYKIKISMKDSNRSQKCRLTAVMNALSMEEAVEMVAISLGGTVEIEGSEITILHVNC